MALLLALAVAGAVGSAIPQGLNPEEYVRRFGEAGKGLRWLGLDRFFTGVLFRGLLGLLAANLLACGLRRSVDGMRGVAGLGRASYRLDLPDRSRMVARLRDLGFTVSAESPLRARRRCWFFLGFPLVHLAPALVMAGALWGSWGGLVGTANTYLNEPVWSIHNWSIGEEYPLPFALVAEDLRFLHYPTRLRVRVGVQGEEKALIETREEGRVRVEGSPYTVWLDRLDTTTGRLPYSLEGPQGRLGPFSSREEVTAAPVQVVPDAYFDRELRRTEVSVSVRGSANEVLVQDLVAVNEPLVYDGYRIFLTAWGEGREGAPTVGFQISRDPVSRRSGSVARHSAPACSCCCSDPRPGCGSRMENCT
ncbi:MAG: cytochrome c biogenesis protein ResB [Deferrisomatales bacterium]|nr:cytochrome c biogenesis protein ResB [Deferrisomatales bacterium]